MAIWKLKVMEKSQIDSSGNIEVRFALIAPNGVTAFDNRVVGGPPTTIQDRAEVIAADFIREFKYSQLIQVGTEVSIDDKEL